MMTVVRWVRSSHFLTVGTLLAAWMADWLFYKQVVGWTLALFALLLCALLVVRHGAMVRSWPARIVAVAVALLVLALIEEPTPLAILMMCVMLGFLVMLRTGNWVNSTSEWMLRWGHFLLTLPLRALLDNRVATRYFRRHPSARPAVERIMLRWVLPAIGGGVFVLLFAAANPVVEQWFSELGDLCRTTFDWLAQILTAGRVLLWLSVAVLVHGLLRHRMYAGKKQVVPPPVQQVAPANAGRGHELVIRCLVVFNAVFAVQTVLDAMYLYGGKALPQGMTYATYAHRGAYPLVATALLAGLFVLLAFRTGGAAQRSSMARRLVYLWIAQNVLLLFSTIWRLILYIDVYSLSRLRVATMVWIVLVAIGFVWVVAMIARHRTVAWLVRVNVATLGAVLFVSAFVNFDGQIAAFNVRHCREIVATGVPLDVEYLESLGTDALPALAWAETRVNADRKAQIHAARLRLQNELRADHANWRGWTFRRHRLVGGTWPSETVAQRQD